MVKEYSNLDWVKIMLSSPGVWKYMQIYTYIFSNIVKTWVHSPSTLNKSHIFSHQDKQNLESYLKVNDTQNLFIK